VFISLLLFIVLSWFLISRMDRGRTWARSYLLVWFALGIVVTAEKCWEIWIVHYISKSDVLNVLTFTVGMGVYLVALLLLFHKSSSNWFREMRGKSPSPKSRLRKIGLGAAIVVLLLFIADLLLHEINDLAYMAKTRIPRFDEEAQFNNGLAPVAIFGTYGFIDKTGRIVISPQFIAAGNFSEGLAWVEVDWNKFGFIDTAGHLTLTPQIKLSTLSVLPAPFAGGLAMFDQDPGPKSKARQWGLPLTGYANRFGQIAIQPRFSSLCSFSDDRASVMLLGGERELFLIDKTGAAVVGPLDYGYSGCFSEGMLAVNTEHGLGYIDRDGSFAIPVNQSFTDADEFSEGLAFVRINGECAYINKDAETTIPGFACKSGGRFKEGLARFEVQSGVAGYIDRTGKWAIPPQFTSAGDFSEGLALVETGGGQRFVDRTGRTVLTPVAPPSGIPSVQPPQAAFAVSLASVPVPVPVPVQESSSATDDFTQSTQDYAQPAVEVGGSSARALNAKALQLLSGNPPDLNGARLALEQAMQLDPADIETLNNLGYVYGRIGDYRSAQTILIRVIDLAPNRTVAYGNLGYAEAKLGETQAAANHFCQYVRHFKALEQGKSTLQRVMNDSDPNVQEAVRATIANCTDMAPQASFPKQTAQPTQARSGVLHYQGPAVPYGGKVVFDNLPNEQLQFKYDNTAWTLIIKHNPDGTKWVTLVSLKHGYQTSCDLGWEIIK
jgi:hypothetical protein